jgi:integrase
MAKLPSGVRIKKNGSFEKRFTVPGIDKRFSVSAKSLNELATAEQELRLKIKNNTYIKNKDITLDAYFEEWIDKRKKQVKDSSICTYISLFKNYISPSLGDVKVAKIEKRQVEKMLDSIDKAGKSAQTTNYVLSLIRMILADAVRDEICTRNIAATIKRMKSTDRANKTYHRALSIEEQQIFLQEIQDDYYCEIIMFLLFTGCRIGEAGAVQWNDIDPKKNVIHITKTVTRETNGTRKIGDTTKTKAGMRDIPLTDPIKDVLKRQKSKMQDLNGVIQFNGRVFNTLRGGIATSLEVNKAIQQAIDRLEANGTHIEHFTCHALRDSFATRCIENGMNPKTLQSILGHENLSMTMDRYAACMPSTKQQEMNNVKWNIG